MSETIFTLISTDGVRDQEWPDNWTEVKTRIDGELADKVRAKTDAPSDAVVVLWERGQDSGYSEYTQEWDTEFQVLVNDKTVFTDVMGYSNALDEETGHPLETRYSGGNGLSRFIEWLDK